MLVDHYATILQGEINANAFLFLRKKNLFVLFNTKIEGGKGRIFSCGSLLG
jgi:hypothetical protein